MVRNVSFANSWVKCGIFKTATAQNRPNIELARVRQCTFCRMAWWFRLISKITIIHLKHSFQNYKVYGVIWMFRFWVVIGDSSWKGDCIDFEWSSRGLMCSFGTPPNMTQHVRLIGEAGKIYEKNMGAVSWMCYMVYMDVSENRGTPKSSIFIGFSIINHPFWGTTIFGNTHMVYIFKAFVVSLRSLGWGWILNPIHQSQRCLFGKPRGGKPTPWLEDMKG